MRFFEGLPLRTVTGWSRLLGAVIWLAYAAAFGLCGWLAFLLRFDFTIDPYWHAHLTAALAAWTVAKLLMFRHEGLDMESSRILAPADLSRIAIANGKGSLLGGVVILLFGPAGFPRSIYLIDFLLCLVATAALRVSMRWCRDRMVIARLGRTRKRVLIYGAGDAGEILLQDIRTNPRLSYWPVGFLDDDPAKRQALIHGLPVLGDGSRLKKLAARHRVDEVLIAIPSATGSQMTAIFERCRAAGVPCKTVPALEEILDGRTLAGQVREIAMEDLLGRHPVELDEATIRASIEGRVVLVTGAGGSIGSELCRQVARFGPSMLVGYEISENALYELNHEMESRFPEIEFYPAIGSIQNPKRLAEVMSRYGPELIYHAAAYKHVPMMEDHIFEAVENNVFGTLNVVRAAEEYGVRKFVLISSDKAVRPANVMGATKRVAELIVKSMQNRGPSYIAVRFGNVLGSNGSVIPLFKKQIAAGGPVTVTHPDMERYFMTISEAVQLVLQAAAMGEGGEIFVLDMGEPVKITELARNLILLSGFRPDAEIAIEFTGIRPGEKLREELNSTTETTAATPHEKIRIFTGPELDYGQMQEHLRVLATLSATRDARKLVEYLQVVVPEYRPSTRVLAAARLPQAAVWPASQARRKAVASAAG